MPKNRVKPDDPQGIRLAKIFRQAIREAKLIPEQAGNVLDHDLQLKQDLVAALGRYANVGRYDD